MTSWLNLYGNVIATLPTDWKLIQYHPSGQPTIILLTRLNFLAICTSSTTLALIQKCSHSTYICGYHYICVFPLAYLPFQAVVSEKETIMFSFPQLNLESISSCLALSTCSEVGRGRAVVTAAPGADVLRGGSLFLQVFSESYLGFLSNLAILD